jgi:hypothetical protein
MFSSIEQYIIDSPSSCLNGCSQNGSQYLLVYRQLRSFTMARLDGERFSLNAFDAAEAFLGLPELKGTRIDLVGNVVGGGSVSVSFDLDGFGDGAGGIADFQTFLLPSDFRDLISVEFSGPQAIAIDNVRIDALAVAEPATWSLLAVELFGVFAATACVSLRRRKPLYPMC